LLLSIQKLVYGGDGLARLPPKPSDDKDRGLGKAAFVPYVLAGEKIDAVVTEEKAGFARAQAMAIVESSPHRTPPLCPYFGRCGGCHYQHAAYDHQLAIKTEILRETLCRIAKVELECPIQAHASPPWSYRNRSRLQVRTRPEFSVAYFRLGSHDLLPVEQCPISSPLINRGITALWGMGRAGKVVEGVHEVEFFANADDSRMLVELVCAREARRSAVRACAEEFCAAMPEISGVTAYTEAKKGVPKTLVTVGTGELTYQVGNWGWRVSAGSFFQTNRFLTEELIRIVTAGKAGELALDLYAGVGLFSTALVGFRHTVSVESSQTAARDLQYNLPASGKAVQATAEQFLCGAKGRAGNGTVLPQMSHKPDLIVVDPPRSGLGDRVARALTNANAPRVTYMSCDPATLARDLLLVLGAGYRIEEVHLVDLFPQTYHLESVVQLVRK
jgi:23S rRNA (uracil1939-C5)-methyltransferase